MKSIAKPVESDDQCACTNGPETWKDRVEAVIRGHERPLHLGVEAIAGELQITTDHLRRRLETEGEGLFSVLEDARFERACEQLVRTSLSIREVSEQLGYSEASSFHRAFKRRAGVTPATYRAARLRQ